MLLLPVPSVHTRISLHREVFQMYIKLHFLACMPYLCTKGELAYCLLWEKTWYFAIYRILLVMRTLPWTNTSILDLVSISDTWIAIAPSTCLSATTFLALGVCVFSLYTGNIHFWIHVRFIIYEPYCKRCFFGHLGRSSNLLYRSRSRTQNRDIQEHGRGGEKFYPGRDSPVSRKRALTVLVPLMTARTSTRVFFWLVSAQELALSV